MSGNRRIHFSLITTASHNAGSRVRDGDRTPERGRRVKMAKKEDWKSAFRVSKWVAVTLLLLFASNLLFLVAFVTNGWGILEVTSPNVSRSGEAGAWWNFGLWQCCRNDGFCLGTRWPVFYSATRALCVMVLFGQALSFAWMVGHSLEKLMDYDKCTMATLISLIYASAVLLFMAVTTFGVRWPQEFRHDFSGTRTYLSYSFYIALLCVPLIFAAGCFATADLVIKRREFQQRHSFWKPEDFDLEDVDKKETNVFIQTYREYDSEISDV